MLNENRRPAVDVIIPVYKPDKRFALLLKMLQKQSYPYRKLIVINTERAYWPKEGYKDVRDMQVTHITRHDFDHAATRNLGARLSRADILLFMTDDALPADEFLIERLAEAFTLKGQGGESVIMAYARQLANKDAGPTEVYTRAFNYPKEGRVKTKADLEKLGIKTFFASNVCCAYDREKFVFQGGFSEPAIFNEDMVFAGHAMMENDYAVVYEAAARVFHSHNYGCVAQFRRNFDLAVSQKDHPEVFAGLRSEGEGIRLVKGTVRYLLAKGKPWLLIGLFFKSACKYAGYRLGKSYRLLPGFIIMACTMNREYWLKIQEKEEGGRQTG